ncbi:hypothetical protein BDZ97DRAFT_1830852 [Flammula alnicola]|nr:hypothetical protein BDZ97DRAFT_1830852 [Flammula alnicola]
MNFLQSQVGFARVRVVFLVIFVIPNLVLTNGPPTNLAISVEAIGTPVPLLLAAFESRYRERQWMQPIQ